MNSLRIKTLRLESTPSLQVHPKVSGQDVETVVVEVWDFPG